MKYEHLILSKGSKVLGLEMRDIEDELLPPKTWRFFTAWLDSHAEEDSSVSWRRETIPTDVFERFLKFLETTEVPDSEPEDKY